MPYFLFASLMMLFFLQLPYYLDGNLKITQSSAIIRHIARQHDLCGKTEEEKVRVDMLENQAVDFRNGFTRLCYREYVSRNVIFFCRILLYIHILLCKVTGNMQGGKYEIHYTHILLHRNWKKTYYFIKD